MHILVVEDEVRLAETLKEILKTQKYTCDLVYDGEDGLAYAESGIYDVILLDIMLPKMNGFDVVRTLRSKKVSTPVILLTARDEVTDKVKGLDCGADDYLTKPFSTEELLARIRAVSDLTLNLSNCTLSCKTKSIKLGYKEFEIMKLLMANPGAIISKDDLLVKVWGYESDAEDNNVEVYISFLRKKLHFLESAVNIATVRKIGYHLEGDV